MPAHAEGVSGFVSVYVFCTEGATSRISLRFSNTIFYYIFDLQRHLECTELY